MWLPILELRSLLTLVWFSLVSLFNGISIIVGELMPKPYLQKKTSSTTKSIDRGGYWEDHVFPKGINLKVNAVARLEFELSYYDTTISHVSHYITETPV